MKQAIDLRVIKTKKNIKNSFISLLAKQDFHEITVQSILDTALINRSTFYKYYQDKYDLAEQLADDFSAISDTYLSERFGEISDDALVDSVKVIYTHMREEKQFIQSLWKINTDTIHPYHDFEVLLQRRCRNYLLAKKSFNPEHADYRSNLYASMILTTITWLFRHEDVSVDAIIQQLKSAMAELLFDKP